MDSGGMTTSVSNMAHPSSVVSRSALLLPADQDGERVHAHVYFVHQVPPRLTVFLFKPPK